MLLCWNCWQSDWVSWTASVEDGSYTVIHARLSRRRASPTQDLRRTGDSNGQTRLIHQSFQTSHHYRFRIGLMNKFHSCYTKCAKMFLGFTKYSVSLICYFWLVCRVLILLWIMLGNPTQLAGVRVVMRWWSSFKLCKCACTFIFCLGCFTVCFVCSVFLSFSLYWFSVFLFNVCIVCIWASLPEIKRNGNYCLSVLVLAVEHQQGLVTWWSGSSGIQAWSRRPVGFLQCFDTVGLVMWPVKIVAEMTSMCRVGR